ncbi:TolB-like 6-blade propeller-like protein [Kordia sp. SMS9]|uniref:BF3164 family lipoprotein n=1 Tax=Kordia sp. SMS9 TaxID=2282170 RepID=UPI000E0D642A|nr:BF3164 family lipoprotein [Kordia sp. SMS9]AXG69863.1 TolB-like 6-blade propeller-like protein [Kordia sp. SMS9]
MKSIRNLLAILLVFFIAISCTKTKVDWYEKVNLTTTTKINKVATLKSSDSLSNPEKLKKLGAKLFIIDSKSNKVIKAFTTDDTYIGSFGMKGKGPGEILSPFGSLDFHNDKVWIFDGTLNKYLGFQQDSIGSNDYKPTENELFFDSKVMFYELGWLDAETIVGLDVSEANNRLLFYNITTKQITNKGSLPPLPKNNIPISIHKQSFMATLKVKPDKNKIALANLYADLIEIYNKDGSDVVKVKTNLDFLPKYELANNGYQTVMGQGGDTKFGYIDMCVSDAKIYALFSGKTRAVSPFAFGKTIHVFDWKGTLLDVIELEKESIAIEIDTDDKNLFVIEFGNANVVQYKL